MKVLIFDPFSGCSGDMILAALVSAGADFDRLQSELGKLGISNFKLEKSEVQKHNISGLKLDVRIGEENVHRHLNHIAEIIDSSGLSNNVKERAKAIFSRLAEAEAFVHNTSLDKVHFHEVGAIDAIVDIVGSCIGLELLGVEAAYSRPISLGSGFIKAAHGNLPLPAPATSALVKDFPVVFRNVESELTTPTGAAIITTLSKPLREFSKFKIVSVGYGAGSRNLAEIPNFLRVFVAETVLDYEHDSVLQIETNIDDQNPEIFSFLFEGLFRLGAKDVFTVPVQMKKNRPGILLTVICSPDDRDKITDFIFANSTTSGMRYMLMERAMLRRENEIIQTSFGPVNVKVYYFGERKRYYPEYEDLKNLAFEHKTSIIDLSRKIRFEIDRIKEN